jgi:endonuclease/exonuclease/phosphatase family metal-dependent hydrolase
MPYARRVPHVTEKGYRNIDFCKRSSVTCGYIPIDRFLVSKEIGILKIRTGGNVGSDHLPLITDLVI